MTSIVLTHSQSRSRTRRVEYFDTRCRHEVGFWRACAVVQTCRRPPVSSEKTTV